MSIDGRIGPATSFTLVNLSDSAEVTLIDLTAQYASDREAKYCRGFHANADGTIMVEGSGGIPGQTVPIKVYAGVSYNLSVKRFLSTGSLTLNNGDIIAYR